MNAQDLINQFVQFLQESALDEERKSYWFKRLEEGLTEKDIDELAVEIDRYFDNIRYTLAVKEAELAEKKALKAQKEAEMLPYLQRFAAEHPALLAKEEKEYQEAVGALKTEMMGELQPIRNNQKEEDIAAIRQRLLSGKSSDSNGAHPQ